MKLFRLRPGKMLAVALVVAALTGTAGADVMYTTSDYTNGALGAISLAKVEAKLVEGFALLGGDTALFSLGEGDAARVLLVEHNITDGDRAYVFSPSEPSDVLFNPAWSTINNTYDAAMLNGKLYVADNGLYAPATNGPVVEVNTTDYMPTNTSYSYTASEGNTSHAVKVAAVGDSLYALFTLASGDYPYDYAQSVIMKLSASMEELGKKEVGENASDMAGIVAVGEDKIAVAYNGGAQESGNVGGIDIVTFSSGGISSEPLELPSNVGEIAAVCYDGSKLYFIGVNYASSEKTLYSTPVDHDARNVVSVDTVETTSYVPPRVEYDPYNNVIVALIGDEIRIYGSDGHIDFDNKDLGGYPYSIAIVPSSSTPQPGGSSGGCGVFGAAGLLALLAPWVLLRLRLRLRPRPRRSA
ncbi:MAG: hypothetical protein LBR38_05510 [Synergistaceae bacterium]|jgi:hypothetical protein|nr:hypothetical protein [Synergistaceae bacterium]